MDKLISVISTALPVFLALFIGMMCRSKGFLTRDGVDTLKKVIINLTLPFVLFNSFATAEYTMSALILPVIIFITCTIMLALGFLWVKLSKSGSKVAPFLASGFEAGMLGFSLFALLFPGESASKFAILDLGQTLFVFTLFKILLSGKTDMKAIGKDIEVEDDQLKGGGGYDHNWCLGESDIVRNVATLYEPESGRVMEVATDQCGMQFYSGNFFNGSYAGKNEQVIGHRCALALETQTWPDAIHHENFPNTVLRPGETYTHTCVYKFSTK